MAKAIYLDACVILSFLRGETGRQDIVDACLTKAKSTNELKLFTSTISIVEIVHLSEKIDDLDPNDFEKIDGFWKTAPIKRVEVSAIVADAARQVMQNRLLNHQHEQKPQIRRRMHDLCHVATAEFLKVDELWTYDPDMKKYNLTTVPVYEPYVDQPSLM